MKFRFDEVSGVYGGKCVIIEAESYNEAIEKFGEVDDKIPAFKRFTKHYIFGLYTVRKEDDVNPEFIIHSTRKI